jgi:hypothetical protein
MKLFKYDEFITESHLQFLLEANVNFTKDFINILGKVDSPIALKLLDIEGTELDINQNYIDINKEKTDTLFFKPDDKVGKVAKFIRSSGSYLSLTYLLGKVEGGGVDKVEESGLLSDSAGAVSADSDDTSSLIIEKFTNMLESKADELLDKIKFGNRVDTDLLNYSQG